MTYVVSVSVTTDILVKADDYRKALEKAKYLVDMGDVELDYMATSENTKYEVTRAFERKVYGD